MNKPLSLLTTLVLPVLACVPWPLTAAEPQPPRPAGDESVQRADLAQGFRTPPDSSKPWAYWWWVHGNVTESSITRDLEAMKRKGFAGFLLFDARGYHDDHLPPPPPRSEFMSAEWRRMVKFAMSEAERLGLQMSINLSSCAGALRGPWPVGDDAPKKLVWASLPVQGGTSFSGELPGGGWGRSWDIAVVAARHDEKAPATNEPSQRPVVEVVDLSDQVDAQHRLTWQVPPGAWTLLRFASVVIEGKETDVDILNAPAVERYFQRMGAALLADAGPAAGKTLTHFYSVSWEGAAPTWTSDLEQEFERYRGYRLRPWLPVLAGMTVQSPEASKRLLRDYHKTLSECFMNNCYGTLRDLCHRAGLKWHSESGGPWSRQLPSFAHADQLAFLGRNDMPQGEFWHPPRGFNRPPAMAAHIYGRPLAAAEAFTHMQPHWSVYPALLKPLADAAFCDGINQFVWHTFTASPPEFGKPGIEYFAGSHVNPNVTWFEQAGGFLAYLGRCQQLLRQGRFVADVCCYTGDKPYLHWGRGDKWSEKASLVLPKGYTYDLINNEVLLERLAVADGDLVLPDGMRYRLLVVDLEDETASPPILRKVLELAKAGGTVVLGQRQPVRAPGLTDYPACDDEVRRLANELWSQPGRLGKGQVIQGATLDRVLEGEGILPDFVGLWDYTHRCADGTEIYFVAGTGQADCTFRVRGKEPELWDPVTGQTRDAVCYRVTDDGRTVVPLQLPVNGSVFVVFRRPAAPRRLAMIQAPDGALELAGRDQDGVRLRVWQTGRHILASPGGEQCTVEAAKLPDPHVLSGPWQVSFAPGWGAPESAVFERLVAWNEHPDQGIKFFSGTATYRKSFDLDEVQAKGLVRLQLGQVKYIAEVRVNGQSLGVVWTDPWAVDLTGIVKPGENKLELDVTNLWVNRLIGDAGLPESQRLTKTHARRLPTDQGRHAHLRGYLATDPLVPSGLLGPVRLEFGTAIRQPLP